MTHRNSRHLPVPGCDETGISAPRHLEGRASPTILVNAHRRLRQIRHWNISNSAGLLLALFITRIDAIRRARIYKSNVRARKRNTLRQTSERIYRRYRPEFDCFPLSRLVSSRLVPRAYVYYSLQTSVKYSNYFAVDYSIGLKLHRSSSTPSPQIFASKFG